MTYLSVWLLASQYVGQSAYIGDTRCQLTGGAADDGREMDSRRTKLNLQHRYWLA